MAQASKKTTTGTTKAEAKGETLPPEATVATDAKQAATKNEVKGDTVAPSGTAGEDQGGVTAPVSSTEQVPPPETETGTKKAAPVPVAENEISAPAAIVICHVRGGRRRGGRRFNYGETRLTEVELNETLIAALIADPEFMLALRPDLEPEV